MSGPTTNTVTGRTYRYTRARGLATWKPQASARTLVEHVQAVLNEYTEYLPLTARQVFYRLVGAYGFPKDDRVYTKLLDALNRGRRAGLIPWDAIRDDGAVELRPNAFDGAPSFWGAVEDAIRHYRLDRQAGQPVALEVWCEAAGMAPQLARVADPFGVAVYSSGGFDSVTVKRNAAARLVARDVPTCILHVGDLDADGCAIVDAAADDVKTFCTDMGGCPPEFVRLAVTTEQVETYGLPTAPAKKRKDNQRSRGGALRETVQAEALDPGTLAAIVRAAVEVRVDADILAAVRVRELNERAELQDVLNGLGDDDATR